MAPLSKDLSGVILPHDKFGTHLDSQCVTIDKDLEMKNFEFAGQTLAEIWSQLVIDGNPVVAEFIDGEASPVTVVKSEEWKAVHVRESQYLLQIVRCQDEACCMSFQSSYLKVVPGRFLPPPLPIVQTSSGVQWAKDDKEATYLSLYQNLALRSSLMPPKMAKKYPKGVPYDLSCPSAKPDIEKRLCPACGLYFGTIKSRKQHKTNCKERPKSQGVEQPIRVRPTRIAARRQHELLCVMAMQEMEWHALEDVDTDGIDDQSFQSVSEVHGEIGTPVLEDAVPVWLMDE